MVPHSTKDFWVFNFQVDQLILVVSNEQQFKVLAFIPLSRKSDLEALHLFHSGPEPEFRWIHHHTFLWGHYAYELVVGV